MFSIAKYFALVSPATYLPGVLCMQFMFVFDLFSNCFSGFLNEILYN